MLGYVLATGLPNEACFCPEDSRAKSLDVSLLPLSEPPLLLPPFPLLFFDHF